VVGDHLVRSKRDEGDALYQTNAHDLTSRAYYGRKPSMSKSINAKRNIIFLFTLAIVTVFVAISLSVTAQDTMSGAMSQQSDLSGTYTGVVEYPDGGMSGAATLTITGNQFTLESGGTTATGRVTAVTTQGYTAVTMRFGEGTEGTTPPTISLRARRAGDRLTLTTVRGENRAFSFMPGNMRRMRGTRSRGMRNTNSMDMNSNMSGEMNMNSNMDMQGNMNMSGNMNGNMSGEMNSNMDMDANMNGNMNSNRGRRPRTRGNRNRNMNSNMDMQGNMNGNMSGDMNMNMSGDMNMNGNMGNMNSNMDMTGENMNGNMSGNMNSNRRPRSRRPRSNRNMNGNMNSNMGSNMNDSPTTPPSF